MTDGLRGWVYWWAVLMLLPCTGAWALDADAEIARLMRLQYGSYSASREGWRAEVDSRNYILKVVQNRKVVTPYGERLYVFVAGRVADEKYPGHATPGVVGAFVLEEKNGRTLLTAASKAMQYGSGGFAPEEVKLMLFGPDHYYGWLYEGGWTGQGYSIEASFILLPLGKKVVELANISRHIDNHGVFDCDDKQEGRKCASLDFDLKIDTSRNDLKVYPLQVTRTGTRGGKLVKPVSWTVAFDEKRWRYNVPKVLAERTVDQ